jgi:hypothetical protein
MARFLVVFRLFGAPKTLLVKRRASAGDAFAWRRSASRPVNVDGTFLSMSRWFRIGHKRSDDVLKAMLALGALVAVGVGLLLPAPVVHGASDHFLRPGVYSQ